ncbi:MAG: hypothetical protein H7841_05260 [Magnetospirillum sp. WYHS-4]
MKLDILDMLTLSASHYIQQAEQTPDPVWAASLYRLADLYIAEVSHIGRGEPICLDRDVSRDGEDAEPR